MTLTAPDVGAMFDAVFPTLKPEAHLRQQAAAERSRREDAFVAEHIAKRKPELVREFMRSRTKIALALLAAAEAVATMAGEGRDEAVLETLMAGDFNEVGRLLAVRVDALVRTEAEDAAELEAQVLLDAQELVP
jgi:hypothetical protein